MLEEWAQLGSAISGLAAAAAVVIALGALRATRRSALADSLLQAFGDMLTSLEALVQHAWDLEKLGLAGEAQSRAVMGDAYRRFSVASSRVELIESALRPGARRYGEWVRTVANNMAVNLLQADESGPFTREAVAQGFARPASVAEDGWPLLSKSTSFLSAIHLSEFEAPKLPKGSRPLVEWWREKITKFGAPGQPSVYSVTSSYLVQHARQLDDFKREYLESWAQEFVAKSYR